MEKNPPYTNHPEQNWVQQLKKILLAGVGAIALAEKEIEQFIKKAIHNGSIRPEEGEEILQEVRSFQQPPPTEKNTSSHSLLEERIEHILHQLQLPTQEELQQLNQQLEQILKRLESLT